MPGHVSAVQGRRPHLGTVFLELYSSSKSISATMVNNFHGLKRRSGIESSRDDQMRSRYGGEPNLARSDELQNAER